MIKEVNTSNITIGQTIKNYKELCKCLEIEFKEGGSTRNCQLKDLKRFIEWEKSGQRFIITEIYNKPLPREDDRAKGNNNLYISCIELLLMAYLSNKEGHVEILSKRNWWELLGMINDKYNKISNESLRELDKSITSFEINHFYQRCNERLSRILFSAIKNLKDRRLISPHNVITIIKDDNKSYVATDKEEEKILRVENSTLAQMGFEKISEVFLHFKQNEFYEEVNKTLFKMYNWKGYYKQIKIIYNLENMQSALPNEIIVLNEKINLNKKIMKTLKDSASRTYDKYNTKDQWGEINEMQFHLSNTYLKAQRILTNELICVGKNSILTKSIDIDENENIIDFLLD